MATRTVVGSTPTPSHPCEGLANNPAAATVGTHPKEAHELALSASYRIEAIADMLGRELQVVLRELEADSQNLGLECLIRHLIKLNSVVMSVLGNDDNAPLADLSEIVGVDGCAPEMPRPDEHTASHERTEGSDRPFVSERIGEAMDALHDAAALMGSIAKDQAPNVGHTMRLARLAADVVDRTINDLDRLDMEAAHG